VLGGIASALAVLIGWWINIEQGPAIVLVLGLLFLIAFLFSPKYGLIAKSRHSRAALRSPNQATKS
jgi:ABC-type Mn2+/Zn2+ transport system permease subunit